MLLDPKDIKTEEVQHWQGLHLLHYDLSSCSQKVRILLRELKIPFTSHPIDLRAGENRTDWYLGINPRGLVPVLVHDGAVHVESNDIIAYLNQHFAPADGSLLPTNEAERAQLDVLLKLEDERHADLRILTFTYLAPAKTHAATTAANNDLSFLGRLAAACATLDAQLKDTAFLLAERLTLADIAWYITLHRLALAGYPLNRHPNLDRYFRALHARPAFATERDAGPRLLRAAGAIYRNAQRLFGRSLKKDLARFEAATTPTHLDVGHTS